MAAEHSDNSQTAAQLRYAIYAILVVTSLGSLIGRICHVESRDGRTPFLSANDRSRWCTIRALADDGTYVIDEVTRRRGWHTIDKVRHLGADGQPHFYSSKPPLFPTLLAGEYWLVKNLTGANLEHDTLYVGRLLLIITNGSMLLVYFGVLILCVERWGQTDWGRVYVLAVAAWGTFLTTFGVTLNNHLPAAVSVAAAIYVTLRIWYDGERAPRYFLVAGFTAAFAAANELPALAFLVAVAAALICRDPRKTFTCFVPAAACVLAAFFATNRIAHDTWSPAYAHPEWYDFEGSQLTEATRKGIDRGEPSKLRYGFHTILGHHGILSLTPVWLLSIIGIPLLARRDRQPALALLVVSLTVICLVFYVFLRPVGDRNYGGVTSGFRWMFWFIPLWLLAMLPAADAVSRSPVCRWLSVAATASVRCLGGLFRDEPLGSSLALRVLGRARLAVRRHGFALTQASSSDISSCSKLAITCRQCLPRHAEPLPG